MPPTQKVGTRRVPSRLKAKDNERDDTQENSDTLQSKADEKLKMGKPQDYIFRILIYPQVESDANPINVLDHNGYPHREFKSFQRLPLELRGMIFTLALPGPRIFEFIPYSKVYRTERGEQAAYNQSLTKCRKPTTTPALLHVNQESQQFALRFYSPCFHEYLHYKGYVYINFSTDTLLVTREFVGLYELFYNRTGQAARGKYHFKQVQNIAMTCYHSWYNSTKMLTYLQGLRKLTKIGAITTADTSESRTWQTEDEKLVEDWGKLAAKGRVNHASFDLRRLKWQDFQTEFRWGGMEWS